jgi:CheY-like chemotaxis protein
VLRLSNDIKRILVVDDEEALRELYPFLFMRLGVEAVCAEDGPTAIKIIENDINFDAIVTDFSMPDMDGLEFLTAVRKIAPQYSGITVVMSGQPDAPNSDVKYDIYISKPVQVTELLESIKSHNR